MTQKIALIVLDTVRKDFWDETATQLKSVADVEYHRAYAPSSWSTPSHASMFTGQLPYQHGVHSLNPSFESLIGKTVWDELPDRSYSMSTNGALSGEFHFGDLFDEFEFFAGNVELTHDTPTTIDHIGQPLSYVKEAIAERKVWNSLVNGLYLKWNKFSKGKPLPDIGDYGERHTLATLDDRINDGMSSFFVNMIGAHSPFSSKTAIDSDVPMSWHSELIETTDERPESEDLENYRQLYQESIQYLDGLLSEFIRDHPDTTFIVTADHGEELWYDHERHIGHEDFTSSLLHVPLIIANIDESVETNELVSLLDIPTLMTSLANDAGLPDITREQVPAERMGMKFRDGDSYWTRAVRTIYTEEGRWEWDELGGEYFYKVDKSQDCEKTERSIPDNIRSTFDVPLDEYLEQFEEKSVDVSQATEERLEDLGYKL